MHPRSHHRGSAVALRPRREKSLPWRMATPAAHRGHLSHSSCSSTRPSARSRLYLSTASRWRCSPPRFARTGCPGRESGRSQGPWVRRAPALSTAGRSRARVSRFSRPALSQGTVEVSHASTLGPWLAQSSISTSIEMELYRCLGCYGVRRGLSRRSETAREAGSGRGGAEVARQGRCEAALPAVIPRTGPPRDWG